MNRGRGKFVGGANARGGGRGQGGGFSGGPLLTNHIRNLDMELQMLQRKRELFEQEQNILDVFSNNINYSSGNINNYSNRRQYDYKQPFYNNKQQGPSKPYNQPASNSYQSQPGPSSFQPVGNKRQANTLVWENQNPPKRFNVPQRPNPWQNQEATSAPQAPAYIGNFSSHTRPFLAPKPGIGQRIQNKYKPQAEHKNFKPSKVAKPNLRSFKKPGYRPSQETKMFNVNPNSQSNKTVGQSPNSKGPIPTISQNQPIPKNKPSPTSKSVGADNILRPNKMPSGAMKGRLELALGMIVKDVKELCPDKETLEYFKISFIQRVIKHTIRLRIKNVMMNEPIISVNDIVDRYRQKYPEDTDVELLRIAQDAKLYNEKHHHVLQLIGADDPKEFYKVNFGNILERKLNDMFSDLQKMYENRKYNIEECIQSLPDLDGAGNENEGKDENEGSENIIKGECAEEDANEKTETSEELYNNCDKDMSDEKTSSGVKSLYEKKNVRQIMRSRKRISECYSADDKNIVEQLDEKCSKSRKYQHLMDQYLEQTLPLYLPRFREMIETFLCFDKEFSSMRSLVLMEVKEKLRKSMEEKMVHGEAKIVVSKDETPAMSETSTKPATTAAKTATPATAAKTATPATAAKTATPATVVSAGKQTVAEPAAKSTVVAAAKPITVASAPSLAAAEGENPAIPSKTVKPATAIITTEITPGTAAAPDESFTLTTPVKQTDKSVHSPKTPSTKDIHYVKLIGHPALPARAVIYDFLNKFKPVSIKKHKTINNLLVIGFTETEGFKQILDASESVVGEAKIIIKASEQVTTPIQNKKAEQRHITPEQKPTEQENNMNELKITTEIITAEEENNISPNDKTNEVSNTDGLNESKDDIISSDLDFQISDLLSSIRKADEDVNIPSENKKPQESKIDNKVADPDKKSEEKEHEINVGEKGNIDTTGDNTKVQDLDTIMEVDIMEKTEEPKAKTVEEVAVKETGRATPLRTSSRLANVTPSTIKTRRASRLANNN